MSRRERQRTATRRDLVLAGRRLFSAKGLYESRIEDITDDAGIGKGTLYLHFGSKEELALAVVGQGFGELRAHIARRLVGACGREEIAARIFASHVEFFAANPDLMRIFHQVRGVLKFGRREWRPLQACLQGHLDFLAQQLDLGPAAPSTSGKRRDLAIFLFGAASGVCSVRVSAFPESRLVPWSLTWSEPVGRVAAAWMRVRGTSGAGRSRPRTRSERR